MELYKRLPKLRYKIRGLPCGVDQGGRVFWSQTFNSALKIRRLYNYSLLFIIIDISQYIPVVNIFLNCNGTMIS